MIRSNGSDAIIKIKISFGTHKELVREGMQGRLLQQAVDL